MFDGRGAQPRTLRRTSEGNRALRAEPREVRRHRIARSLRVAARGELLVPVLRQRLQLREANGAATPLRYDEGLVDQCLDQVGDVLDGDRVVRADGFRRGQITSAGEHRETLEDTLLGIEEQVVAPVDHGRQRLLARQRRA